MNQRKWLVYRPFVGLLLGLGVLAGCDGGGDAGSGTQTAGIPGVRGPAAPNMKKAGAAGKAGASKAGAKETPKAEGAGGGQTPAAPKE